MHCKSYSHFFSKKLQHICVSLSENFNESLTNDVVSFEQLGPGIEWLLKLRFANKSKNGGGICSSDRYMIHLFCLVVQTGFYCDMVECRTLSPADWLRSPVVALEVFSPVTSGIQCK